MPDPQSPAPHSARVRIGERAATDIMGEVLDRHREFIISLSHRMGVNSTDVAAMELILMYPPIGPSDLARRLGLSTAAATTIVDRLVTHGHVTREQHPTDKRAIVVTPTPASSERILATVMPVIAQVDRAVEEFDEEERSTIARYLELVLRSYNAADPV